MTSLGLRAARAAFSVADHIAPSLNARIAFELFCRISRRMSPRERAAVEAAAGFMATARHHRLRGKRATVVAHEFRPRRWIAGQPTVLVVHSWQSRTEHMRTVIEGLMASGLRVLALDMPGHGASPGRKNNMALAVEAVGLAAQWFGPFRAIVGHSFGGAVAVNAVAGSVVGTAPVAAERLVLVAAPSSMPALFEDFGRFLNLGTRTQTGMADLVEQVAGHPLETYVAADQLAELGQPTLVIHAPDDREIPFGNAKAFEKAGPHVTLQRAPGLGHRRILGDARVADDVAAFVVGQAIRKRAAA